MKKFLLILTCALGALCTVKAQTYAAIPDTIWGCRYFSQNLATDFPYSSGYKKGYYAGSWPVQNNTDMRYYARIPEGHVKATLVYNPRVNRALNLDMTVTNMNTGRVVIEKTITTERATSGGEFRVEMWPDMIFTADVW